MRQGRYTEAKAIALEAVDTVTTWFDAGALLIEAKAERHLGRRNSAYRILRRLIETTEENAGALSGDEHSRQSFFESRAAAYVELAALLVEDGRFAEAPVVADRAKGRLLLDTLRRGTP